MKHRTLTIILVLALAALGSVACDKETGPTEPKSPDLPKVRTACRVVEVGTQIPALGQLCSLSVGSDSFPKLPTQAPFGLTEVRTLTYPKGFFEQSEADWQAIVAVESPEKCGLDGQPKCYERNDGSLQLRWYNGGSEGMILVATIEARRVAGGIGLAGR